MLESGDGLPPVALSLTWDGPRRLSIDPGPHGVTVVAHAELSQANVVDACRELDPVLGQAVLSAWLTAVQHPQ